MTLAIILLILFLTTNNISASNEGGYVSKKISVDIIEGDGETASFVWPDYPFGLYYYSYFLGYDAYEVEGFIVPRFTVEVDIEGKEKVYDSVENAKEIKEKFDIKGTIKTKKRGVYSLTVAGKGDLSGESDTVEYCVYGKENPIEAEIDISSLYKKVSAGGSRVCYKTGETLGLSPKLTVVDKNNYDFDEYADVRWFYMPVKEIVFYSDNYYDIFFDEYSEDPDQFVTGRPEGEIKYTINVKNHIDYMSDYCFDNFTHEVRKEFKDFVSVIPPVDAGEYLVFALIEGNDLYEPKILETTFEIDSKTVYVVPEKTSDDPEIFTGKQYGDPDERIACKVYNDEYLNEINTDIDWSEEYLLSRTGYGTVEGEECGEYDIFLNPDMPEKLKSNYNFKLLKPIRLTEMPRYTIGQRNLERVNIVFFDMDDPETDPGKKKLDLYRNFFVGDNTFKCSKESFYSFCPAFKITDTVSVLKTKEDGVTPVDKIDGRAVYTEETRIIGSFGEGVIRDDSEMRLDLKYRSKEEEQISYSTEIDGIINYSLTGIESGHYGMYGWGGRWSIVFEDDEKSEYDISMAEIKLKKLSQSYNGEFFVPEIDKVILGGHILAKEDYATYATIGNMAGEYSIWIEGRGDYSGKKELKFRIEPLEINVQMFSIGSGGEYTGDRINPEVAGLYGEAKLKNGLDYTVAYKNNVNAGTATAVITGLGNFSGTVELSYKITPRNMENCKVKDIDVKAWSGTAITPGVTVSDGDKVLKEGTDYSLSYRNNTAAGEATVIITGEGNYSGSLSKTFTIKKVTLKYRVYVQKKNWMSWVTATISNADKAVMAGTTDDLRMETIQMQMSGIGGSVKYRAYVEKMGWTQWATTADTSTYAGTKGESKRVEMIQLQAKGQVASLYDIYYRAYAEKLGWLGWASNNGKAGTAGYAYKLEAFQVCFMVKGEKLTTAGNARAKSFYDKTKDGANPK